MIQKASTIVTLAELTFVGLAIAQQEQKDTGTPAAQPGVTGKAAQFDQQAGQQVDQQINQQLKQFAQDPNTACDKLFVLKAACGNQFEVQLGQQAQQKAQSQQVKDIAQKIVQDHQQALEKLQPIAQQLGVQLPQGLGEMKQTEIQILTSLPADQFEKQYICMMQANHAMVVTAFQGIAQLAKNEQVKQYAQDCLPKLQEHAQSIEQCAVALGLPASNYNQAQPAGGRIQGTPSDRNR
jgi:predicted outer membrane protein